MSKDEGLAIWKIHAGPSLVDPNVAPIRIGMDLDILHGAWEGQECAWRAILETVAEGLCQA